MVDSVAIEPDNASLLFLNTYSINRKEKEIYLYKSPNHVVNLNSMRLSGKLCDVTIKADDKKLRAYKVILAANLKYFESMFLSSFQESKQDVITMKGVGGTNLEAFISFAYTGEILLTENNALNLLEVANYLSEEGIKEACIDFLKMHLKDEEACRVYKFSNTIDSISLKNVAKQTILSNFQWCSQETEFFDLDCENLKDILSDARSDTAERQHMYFEGVMRWIVHDVKNRRTNISDLLTFIDMTKLATDYLLEYFCKGIESQDYDNITTDVMAFYRKRSQHTKNQTEDLKQNLLMVGGIDKKLHFQSYDFEKKNWTQVEEITGSYLSTTGYVWNFGAMLNNKFYYIINHKSFQGTIKRYLHVFDPVTRQNIMLACESRLQSFTAIFACSKYIYFCGGEKESCQILRYNPQTNSFETLPPMGYARMNATAIFYQGCLYVLGGSYNSLKQNTVEKYDPDAKRWSKVAPMRYARGKCSAAILEDKLYVCGGWWCNSVEVYDPSETSWELLANMNQERYDALLVAREGKLLAVGGNFNRSVEVYDPIKNQWQTDHEVPAGLKIPFGTGALIPSSNVEDDD